MNLALCFKKLFNILSKNSCDFFKEINELFRKTKLGLCFFNSGMTRIHELFSRIMWCLNSLVVILIKSIEFRQLLLLCEINPKALLKNVQTSNPMTITCEYPFIKRKLFVKGSYLNFNKCTKSK